MMLNRNELFFFFSYTANEEKIEKWKEYKQYEKIKSIYHVCGRFPWLMVFNGSIEDAITLNSDYQLDIGHMSVASGVYKKIEVKGLNKEDEILSWVFIRGSKADSFIEEITKKQEEENRRRNASFDYKITEVYKIVGEGFHFVVKIYTKDIRGIDEFLIHCRKREMGTSTKCVLSCIKEDGIPLKDDIETKREKATAAQKEVNYAVTRVMANTRGFIQKTKDDQKRILEDELRRRGIPFPAIDKYILDPNVTLWNTKENEYSQCNLEHFSGLIDRYSIKLVLC